MNRKRAFSYGTSLFTLVLIGAILLPTACVVENQEAANVEIAQQIIRALDEKTPDVFDDLIAEDCLRHQNNITFKTTGPDLFKQSIQWDDTTYSEVKYSIKDIFADKDKVALRVMINGTTPAGAKVEHLFISIMRFEDGKAKEGWIANDFLSLHQQMAAADSEQ